VEINFREGRQRQIVLFGFCCFCFGGQVWGNSLARHFTVETLLLALELGVGISCGSERGLEGAFWTTLFLLLTPLDCGGFGGLRTLLILLWVFGRP